MKPLPLIVACVGLSLLAPLALSDGQALASPAGVAAAETAAGPNLSLFSFTGLTGDSARIRVRGAVGAELTVTSSLGGDPVTGTIPTGNILEVDVPVAKGTAPTLTGVLTLGGEAGEPATIVVDRTLTSLAAPTSVSTAPSADRGKAVVLAEGAQPGALLIVKNARGEVVGTGPGATGTSSLVATWDPRVDPADRRFTILQKYDGLESPSVPFRIGVPEPLPTELEAPTISEVGVLGDWAQVIVTSDVTSKATAIEAVDFYGRVVASNGFTNGYGNLNFTVPPTEASYRVRLVAGTGEDRVLSPEVPVVTNAGLGTLVPAAPTLNAATETSGRLVADVTATPGAKVIVRDADDKVVALRLAGATGRVQLAVPVTGRAAGEYFVTQATGVIESDPVAVPTA
ncbi:hypothetical protein [Frondihabitans cladoniiphilus]|uniref:Ig-like domain-containing protein n=1 Tax=Frondihabitans cladoniiphilus TaxID=715785 RepID=A0ABP8VY47_9MICO